MNKSEELFVDNFVIVQASQEIAFDTSDVISALQYEDIYYIQYKTVEDAKEAVETFEQYPSVIFAETDEVVYVDDIRATSAEEASPLLGKDGYTHLSWGITQTGLDIFADYVSKHSTESVNIAVVDTGVYASHPFLQGYISSSQYDVVDDDAWAEDPRGHGTYVSGIIVDAMRKLNFSIIPVRVIEENGTASEYKIAEGVRCAMTAGADVINMSLGITKEDHNHGVIDVAIQEAIARNIVVVVTAGNDAKSTSTKCPSHLTDPIVVSGIDKNGVRYSNTNYGGNVDVTGPAVAVKSCVIPEKSSTGYGKTNGTSAAAPHVTAAAAMLKLLNITANPDYIQSMIKAYTDDVGSIGTDIYFGNGLMKISNKVITLPFTDVLKSDYYYNGVYSGYGRGYISGLDRTTFAPTANMQRQDVAVVLYKMAGSPNVEYDDVFSDVSEGHYFAKAAVWANNNGIISGLVGGSLGVGQPITRQDFAAILYRYAEYRDLDRSATNSLGNYIDRDDVSPYAQSAVRWAVAHGIMGNDKPYLRPQDNISRAELTVMVYQFLCL